jgi:hypothetical protein
MPLGYRSFRLEAAAGGRMLERHGRPEAPLLNHVGELMREQATTAAGVETSGRIRDEHLATAGHRSRVRIRCHALCFLAAMDANVADVGAMQATDLRRNGVRRRLG